MPTEPSKLARKIASRIYHEVPNNLRTCIEAVFVEDFAPLISSIGLADLEAKLETAKLERDEAHALLEESAQALENGHKAIVILQRRYDALRKAAEPFAIDTSKIRKRRDGTLDATFYACYIDRLRAALVDQPSEQQPGPSSDEAPDSPSDGL